MTNEGTLFKDSAIFLLELHDRMTEDLPKISEAVKEEDLMEYKALKDGVSQLQTILKSEFGVDPLNRSKDTNLITPIGRSINSLNSLKEKYGI